jgi:hypothetical protein
MEGAVQVRQHRVQGDGQRTMKLRSFFWTIWYVVVAIALVLLVHGLVDIGFTLYKLLSVIS